jgi:hypothetical protein
MGIGTIPVFTQDSMIQESTERHNVPIWIRTREHSVGNVQNHTCTIDHAAALTLGLLLLLLLLSLSLFLLLCTTTTTSTTVCTLLFCVLKSSSHGFHGNF